MKAQPEATWREILPPHRTEIWEGGSGYEGHHAIALPPLEGIVFTLRNRSKSTVTASLAATLRNPLAWGDDERKLRNEVITTPDTTYLTLRTDAEVAGEDGGHPRESQVDGVVAAVSNDQHVNVAVECLQRRVPIMLEKPIAATLEEADQIIHACDRNGVKIFVVHQNRYNMPIIKAREAFEQGRFGGWAVWLVIAFILLGVVQTLR